MHVLVINSGSSSVKFRAYDMDGETCLIAGAVTRLGEDSCAGEFHYHTGDNNDDVQVVETAARDHAEALQQIFAVLENTKFGNIAVSLSAVGHRVVHGGELFQAPTRIDHQVIDGIRDMVPLAPLHNPANLAGIEATCSLCPQLPQVAVFDTSFFRTLPSCAYRYAVPDEWYRQYHIRRFGFHGISHQSAVTRAAAYLQRPPAALRMITLHLGNGASMAAIRDGVCIDTSMGMTPLAGLVMGTRCGDLDPSVHFYLSRALGMSIDEIETLLNHDSGLKGLCGVSDMRDVKRLARQGNEQASVALDMYCYRICKYIGAYHAILGGLDALVFTGGVGENDAFIRQSVCTRLAALGITLDPARNQHGQGTVYSINEDNSDVSVLVIAANEELEIARQVISVVGNDQA